MAIPISNVPRRVVYAASGTGPYAFTFEILANTDIGVYKDDTLLTLTTDYTVTIGVNGTGSITLTAAPTGATQIAIVGNRTIQRTTDFVTGGDFFANTVNAELDQQTIFAQQNAEGLARSLQAPQTDPTTIDMTLPRASVRAGKYMAFDEGGNPVAAEGRTEVAAVYAIRDDIVAVSAIDTQVVAVADNETNVNTVATNIGNVNSVGTNIANVNAVAGNATNINAVNANKTNIDAVAGNATNINAVSSNATNINAVNANKTNIDTVAGINANVTTVAGISANVTSVATNSTNVNTVATNIASVNTNATNIANINQNAANITAIQGASANATAAAASATSASTSATSAASSAASASAVVLGNEPVRPSIRPSLLLDFANTKQLDPRITFTRASTATYYDGKTVAKAEENLVTYSQDFDVTSGTWGKNSSTVSSNTTVAPDGTTTADTITLSAGTAQKGVQRSIFGGAIPYTFSIYAKAGTQSIIQLSFNWVATYYANFDLSTGTLGTVGATVTASITAVGNGWYRCSITRTDVTGVNALYIEAVDATTSGYRATTASTGDFFIWGAQLEQRSSVTAYTPTTTAPITNYIPALQTAAAGVPRFDHNPVTGESLGLLIEEQRTNLLTRSEEFDNAAWTKNNATITSNTLVAPDGALTGDKLVETTAAGWHGTYIGNPAGDTLAAHTVSLYAKAGERSWLFINFSGNADKYTYFNLTTGVVGTNPAGSTATITPVGNGWYRCTVQRTVDNLATNYIFGSATADNTASYTGDGYSGIYIWGAQLEAGSFATSYIPTVASQVTRSADAASMTGTNFSSWYRADEGTIYGEAAPATVSGFRYIAAIRNAGAADSNNIGFSGASGLLYSKASNVDYAVLTSGAVTANSPAKVSGAYKVNDFALSTNGGAAVTDTSGLVPVVDQMLIGNFTGTNILNGTIKKLAYYPKRLTNAELQGLTTV